LRWYYWVGVIVFVVLGVTTLIPAPASKPSLLGYYAHCSFTPISTVICWVIAGVTYWFGRKRSR
jgi:polyferredoxin